MDKLKLDLSHSLFSRPGKIQSPFSIVFETHSSFTVPCKFISTKQSSFKRATFFLFNNFLLLFLFVFFFFSFLFFCHYFTLFSSSSFLFVPDQCTRKLSFSFLIKCFPLFNSMYLPRHSCTYKIRYPNIPTA